jgi:hypothetical protein
MFKHSAFAPLLLLLSFAAADAQSAPNTTEPNVSNLLSQCSSNTPVVGNGSGSAPKCHASGALGSAAFTGYTAGSWTPVVTTSGTVGTPAYSTQIGTYEQIGRQVTVRFALILSGWTGSPTGNVLISGLPVASANITNDDGVCHIGFYTVSGLAGNVLSGIILANSANIVIYQSAATGTVQVTQAQFGSTGTIVGSCNYHT